MCLLQKEGQSTIETVGRRGAWMLFRYKTDPKKANVLQGRQLTWTGLRKFTENAKSRISQSLTDHLQEVLDLIHQWPGIMVRILL